MNTVITDLHICYLHLQNYKDAEKIGVKYIASRTYNDDFDKVLEKYYNYSILYDEFGWRIYQLNSLKAAAN